MSPNSISYLALRLEGPLQAWGFESVLNIRKTGLMPTKSAIAGMCCAALGYDRGCDQERVFLEAFSQVRMTAMAIPRGDKHVRRMQDFHTVQNTRTADGKIKNCQMTYRQYLCDAGFGILLEGDSQLLQQVSEALKNPVWGLWLGRKSCIPSAPILAGLRDTKEEALQLIIGDQALDKFTRQEDAKSFAEGRDTIMDSPISFASNKRQFAPRRVANY